MHADFNLAQENKITKWWAEFGCIGIGRISSSVQTKQSNGILRETYVSP
jgi:hypothetical protein